MEVNNIESLPENYIWKDTAGLITKFLGEAAGSRKIYVNIDCVPANAYSTKYHSHSQQEEFFLILSGSGTLRLNGTESTVSTGDFIAKPAGQNIAHTFYNSGNEVLTILDAGTIEKEDTCYYPDEDMYLHKSNNQRVAFSGSDLNQSWTSSPNSAE
ncbi:MAG TPA: mannose-6-phosphate isomerase [Clostridiales bacterium]|nr:mannose-6-phosphate isomerase [Clostridiales bacterium]